MMKLKIMALFVAAALSVCFTGCSVFGIGPGAKGNKSSQSEAENPDDGQADLEYPVSENGATLDSRPGIVVSLAPSITEKVRELGLSERLEGTSDFCDQPDGARRVLCGTADSPDIDAILSISPHLLITEKKLDERASAAISEQGIAIAVIPRAKNTEELKANYQAIACLFEGKKTGAALGGVFIKKLEQKLDGLSQNALTETKNAVYLRVLDFEVATGDTLENELMGLIGLNNIAKEYTGWMYPEDEADSADGKANFESIDFIFCDKDSVTIKMLEQSTFYKGLNAVRKDYYLYIDSLAFERQTLQMFDELERMERYAKGEIPGSKDELEAAAETA